MPVSHIGLTVSHLPTSCSFFLEALQPLGYKYLGQDGNQMGFGIRDPDFFICQESHGNKAGAAHIAFSAPTRDAVDEFYTRALRAGAKSHGRPGTRDRKSNYYSASVLDFDGNSIEVVYRPSSGQRTIEDGHGVRQTSKVLTWQKDIATRSVVASDTGSVVSNSSYGSAAAATPPAATAMTTTTTTTSATSAGTSTTIIGTLIGVAAGAAAAAAYFENAKATETPAASVSHTLALENTPPPTNNNTYALEQGPTSYYAPPSTVARTTTGTKAIEPPPTNWHGNGESYIWRGGDRRSEVGGGSIAEPLRRSRSGSVISGRRYHPLSARVSEAPESIVSSFVSPGRHKPQQRYGTSKPPSTILPALDVQLPRSLIGVPRYSINDDDNDNDDASTIRPPPTVAPSDSISQVSSKPSRHRSTAHSTASSHRTSSKPHSHSPSTTSSAHKPRPAPSHARSIVSFAHGSSAGRSSASILGFPIRKQVDDDEPRGSVKRSGSSSVSRSSASAAGGAKGYTLYEERRADE